MKKTNRKNKTGLVVNWPSGFYTTDICEDHPHIDYLWKHNQHFGPLITLRSRLEKAKKTNVVTVLGTIKGSKGRPLAVYANVPVSQQTIDAARAAGVCLNDNIPNVVNVMNVVPNTDNVVESVETEVHTDRVTASAV